MTSPPLPPPELALRVGVMDPDDPLRSFDEVGRHVRGLIDELLGDDWSWDGKRVLDFGCGAGKVLRHFMAEAQRAEFHGCDIDEPSIDWLRGNLSPPFHVFVNGAAPPLPGVADGSYDLVFAMSVFTHLTTEWSGWLAEMHRVLAPGGLLLASFLGRGMSRPIAGEEWVEDRVGITAVELGRPWNLGGPNVLVSPWWLRAHWGRAFDVVELEDPPEGHGLVLLRRRDVVASAAELERPDPNDPREVAALIHQLGHMQRELGELRRRVDELERGTPAGGLLARLARLRGE